MVNDLEVLARRASCAASDLEPDPPGGPRRFSAIMRAEMEVLRRKAGLAGAPGQGTAGTGGGIGPGEGGCFGGGLALPDLTEKCAKASGQVAVREDGPPARLVAMTDSDPQPKRATTHDEPTEAERALGEELARRRKARNMTQEQFADYLGKSLATVRANEAGRRLQYWTRARELAERLDTTPDELLGISGSSEHDGTPVTAAELGGVFAALVPDLQGRPEQAERFAQAVLGAIATVRGLRGDQASAQDYSLAAALLSQRPG